MFSFLSVQMCKMVFDENCYCLWTMRKGKGGLILDNSHELKVLINFIILFSLFYLFRYFSFSYL